MAEENKLNQTPEITPAPSAEAPEKAPTTGELLGDVEHYDEEKDDWSTGYYGTGSRQQVTDDVFQKLETGETLTRDDFIKAELALQDAKLEPASTSRTRRARASLVSITIGKRTA